jgi:hypothetical protein
MPIAGGFVSRAPTPGYLTDTEASHLLTQALPGAVMVHLKRDVADDGAPARRMFIELSLSEAVQHWRQMGELIRKAGALERQSMQAGTMGNL